MGEIAGPASAALSIASLGFTVEGDQLKAQGQAAGDTYKAETLERAATYGRLQADQVSGQLTQRLAMTLGNIDATRAAAHDDPTSPTGAAVRDFAETTGTTEKNIKVDSILAQSQQDESDAAYMRQSAKEALLSGDIAATGDFLKGISGAIGGLGGGGGGGGSGAISNTMGPTGFSVGGA